MTGAKRSAFFYKEKYLRALEKIAIFYMKEHKFEKSIEYCKQIIDKDELHEAAYVMAIRSYMEIGNHKAASDLYKKIKRALKDELNQEPSPEIKNLFSR